VEVAGVRLVPQAAVPVAREDPVLGRGLLTLEVGDGGIEVGADHAVAADPAVRGVVAAVPPDRVARVSGPVEVVARCEVLDPDVVGLPHQQAVETARLVALLESLGTELLCRCLAAAACSAWLGAVDYDAVAVHTADIDPRLGDEHARHQVRTT